MLPHQVLFPLLGLALGIASPVLTLLTRYWLARPVFRLAWLRSEVQSNLVFYLSLELGTVAAFVVFGFVLGLRSENQRAHNEDLRRRIALLHLRSITDGLTGAFSHAYLQETLALEIARARRAGQKLSVLMIDIDDFKKINDAHGHLFGDRVLVELVETLSLVIRKDDVLGRYGGEEFFVIMPGADLDTARLVAERICRAVSRRIPCGGKDISPDPPARPVRMSVSIGAASSLGPGEDACSIIRRADESLYLAKRAGKNRVGLGPLC
jgi:diguanylate cyclase (GGDEF)-like protein